MKKPLLILSLLLSTTTFSSLSFGEYELVDFVEGTKYFIDFDRIRKARGKVYAWMMQSFPEQTESGIGSIEAYNEVECELFRLRIIRYNAFAQDLARGTPFTSFNEENPEWVYPRPNSVNETQLSSVCDYVNSN